jgi:hypothetical protein
MSSSFTTASLLISAGAVGATVTGLTELVQIWRRRATAPGNSRKSDTRVTIRYGDDQLELKGASTEEMLRLIQTFIDHKESTPRALDRAPDANGGKSDPPTQSDG